MVAMGSPHRGGTCQIVPRTATFAEPPCVACALGRNPARPGGAGGPAAPGDAREEAAGQPGAGEDAAAGALPVLASSLIPARFDLEPDGSCVESALSAQAEPRGWRS